MSDTMQGRRLPDRDVFKLADLRPGDYLRMKMADGSYLWYVCLPTGGIGDISGHHIEEHGDGTITASPSILFTSPDTAENWHGWLTAGVWRSV